MSSLRLPKVFSAVAGAQRAGEAAKQGATVCPPDMLSRREVEVDLIKLPGTADDHPVVPKQ